jgi:putative component of membrane protein insertase Oxa1/YidC/SpoIIIJ protein YidD
MIEALKVHGIFAGFYLGLRRLIRCHPWGTHGYDPVPPKGHQILSPAKDRGKKVSHSNRQE